MTVPLSGVFAMALANAIPLVWRTARKYSLIRTATAAAIALAAGGTAEARWIFAATTVPSSFVDAGVHVYWVDVLQQYLGFTENMAVLSIPILDAAGTYVWSSVFRRPQPMFDVVGTVIWAAMDLVGIELELYTLGPE